MGPELCWGREFKQSPSKQAGEHTCIDCFLSDLDWAYGITVSSPHCLDFPTMVDDTRELSANINTFSPKLLYSGYFLTATEIILELLSWNIRISLSDLRWCTQQSWQTITDLFFFSLKHCSLLFGFEYCWGERADVVLIFLPLQVSWNFLLKILNLASFLYKFWHLDSAMLWWVFSLAIYLKL